MSSRIRWPISFRVRSSAGPEITISNTVAMILTSDVIGCSVSAGKASIASTLFLISLAILVLSTPATSSTVTEHNPSDACEVILSIPSLPLIASSIRTQTADSTSSGAAPR